MPRRKRRLRLVSVAWLVDEEDLWGVVETAEASGFSVTVSPTVQHVDGPARPGHQGLIRRGTPARFSHR